jgi:hypothetical protein
MKTTLGSLIAVLLTVFAQAGTNSEQVVSPLSPGDRARLLEHWQKYDRAPQDYLVGKFRDNRWVFVGEYHRIRHDVELIGSLVPVLHETTDVRHLAWEFLCRDRTEEANRLVTAETYDRETTVDFFRGQFPGWSYQEYLDIFEQTWKSNRRFAKERGPFRLVGLHPCPDYELIHYGSDAEAVRAERRKQERYDEIMAEALEEKVLRPGHKALVYTGIAHATGKFREYRIGTEDQLVRMGNLVYRQPYKKEMFFVCLHAPFWDSAARKEIYPFDAVLDELMLELDRDIGFDVIGTPFETLVHRERSPHSITSYRFGELYDGYVIFRQPIKQYVGVTCIDDWITDETQLRQFARNLANKEASERFSETPFPEFRRDFCAPRPDHGVEFRRRFRNLPDP